jgi:SP family sugar:H+ symporter-like MFS transporter
LGYDSLVISGTLDYLAAYFKLDAWGIGFAASVAQLGGLVGALGGGWIADRVGLKRSLYLCAILFIASAIGIYFASAVNAYTFWRLICGLSGGVSTIVAPMYVTEISPAPTAPRLQDAQRSLLLTILSHFKFETKLRQSTHAMTWNNRHLNFRLSNQPVSRHYGE